ncbi:TonB-dependent hemoglobin/transferrin/lactoferrin family receptor [Martelella lutilitoris]|uniref:TonB-dependent hemoglobin/transferrin/lactoferrin family receptor n=1 Tax=Martelella lutilitoris TaxID=2583532 RepID=A0A5C4JUG7_9HYPH|nr:TonB-dependent hemoglobin/transferrin/lactoferrin family receptor [Martelella lutilitoris]
MRMGLSRTFLLASCTALASAVLTHSALAQDASSDDATTLLPAVNVTTTGGKDGIADTPLATETTRDALDANIVSDFGDFTRVLEPGVTFVGDDSGSVNIRGMQGPRVSTVIDGIQLPYLDDAARGDAVGNMDSFSFDSIATIDIVRGSDSSRSGSGSLGGTVVLRTLEPEDLIDPEKGWGGRTGLMYDSTDQSINAQGAFAIRSGNTSMLFQGDLGAGSETENQGTVGGYGATRSEPNPASFDENNLLFKLRQQFMGAHTLGLTLERYDRDKDIDLLTEQGDTYAQDDWNGSEIKHRDRVSIDYNYEAIAADGLFDSAFSTFYWLKSERESGTSGTRLPGARPTPPYGPYSRTSRTDDERYGWSGWAAKGIETGSLFHNFTIGGDFYYSQTSQYSSGEDNCGPGPYSPYSACNFLHTNQADTPDVDGYVLGLYAHDEIIFGDSGFALTPGVRFDWYQYDPKETQAYTNNPNYNGLPDGQSDWRISPKILATYDLTDFTQLYGQFSTAFRAPTPGELYVDYGGPGTYLRIGNPDLKPETSWGFELGANFGDDDDGGRISAFYSRYKDFIDTQSVEPGDVGIASGLYPFGITQTVNIDNVEIAGVEASVQKSFINNWDVRASLAFARGFNMDTNEILGSVAPLKAVIGGGYNDETWGVNSNWILSAKVPDGSTADFKAPGYGIVDVTAWWAPERFEGMTLQAGVYNLFDQTYYDALELQDVTMDQPQSFYSEPGRTFKISLTQTF